MIPEGTEAPAFELPGWVAGERRRVALEEFLGRDVVIVAFYPGDFNPACGAESDLDELDLFTMQKDVSVLGIGPDTLYSHEAFADEYDLQVPLLADTRREVAEAYGVAYEDGLGQSLIERAVVVVDHDGEVTYTWHSRDPRALPPVGEIKDALADTGGDDTAFARYRIGHAHYVEGRRAFTSAMHAFRDSEWMIAQADFKRAREEFEEAAEHFDSAARFVDDEFLASYYDHSQEKATALWQAADWLGQSASAYSSGSGARGQQLRDDAERPLETARDIGEPIDPDEWPPDPEADDDGTILPREDVASASLAVDIDEAVAAGERPAGDDDRWRAEGSDADGDGVEGADTIDDAELEELEAELAANRPEDPEGEAPAAEPTSVVDGPPGARGEDEDGESDGAADGDVDADDVAALEAEMAAKGAGDAGARDGESSGGGDAAVDGDADGEGSTTGDSNGPGAEEPAVDPHADLAGGTGGAGGGHSATSRSLEPQSGTGGGGAGADGTGGRSDEHPDEEPELAEPQGASDEDLAGIPTADELAEADDGDGDDGDGDGPSD